MVGDEKIGLATEVESRNPRTESSALPEEPRA